jgi:polyhydroxybutyrate depolymerase
MNQCLKFVLFGLASSIISLNACAGSLPSSIQKGPATYHRRMDLVTGGFQRSYRVYIPSGYDGLNRLPLVVAIHGAFDTAKGMEKFSGFSISPANYRKMIPFIILMRQKSFGHSSSNFPE